MALGLFDRPSRPDIMLKFPQLYKVTQNKDDFNLLIFWGWMGVSFIHSIFLFFICYGFFTHGSFFAFFAL
jgi:phospholipid-transporting ATPase